MSPTLPEQAGVQLALGEIAQAREHLRLASEILSASAPPRRISEPVATLVVMLAAVKFGLRHQLHFANREAPGTGTQIAHAASRALPGNFSIRNGANGWQRCSFQYLDFRNNKGLDLPGGDYLIIPEAIDPL